LNTCLAAIIGVVLAVPHCRAAADTDSIVGHWQTDEVLSQLGPSVTTYSFTTNGLFTLATKFTQTPIAPMSVAGTYHVITDATNRTNTLVTVARGRTNTAPYYFQGSTLVIDEGRPSKIFRLRQKP
jgi:hypothetical protein